MSGDFSEEQKWKAALHEVKEEHHSIRSTAKKYALRRTTLQDKVLQVDPKMDTRRGPEPIMGRENEAALITWLETMRQWGFAVEPIDMKIIAARFLDVSDSSYDKWWRLFQHRHPDIFQSHARNIEKKRATMTTEQVVRSFLQLVKDELDRSAEEQGCPVQAEDVADYDEMGTKKDQRKTSTLNTANTAACSVQLAELSSHISLCVLATAAGQYADPFIIFTGKKCPNGWNKPNPGGIYDGWSAVATENGSLDETTWPKVWRHLKGWIERTRRRGPNGERYFYHIIVDGLEAHLVSVPVLTEMLELKIKLICMPAHTSHVFAGLDLWVFCTTQAVIHDAKVDFARRYPGHSFNQALFVAVMKDYYHAMFPPRAIKKGFADSGLWPVDLALADRMKAEGKFAPASALARTVVRGIVVSLPNLEVMNIQELHNQTKALGRLSVSPPRSKRNQLDNVKRGIANAGRAPVDWPAKERNIKHVLHLPTGQGPHTAKRKRKDCRTDTSKGFLANTEERMRLLDEESKEKEVAAATKRQAKQEKEAEEGAVRAVLLSKGYLAVSSSRPNPEVTVAAMQAFLQANAIQFRRSLQRPQLLQLVRERIAAPPATGWVRVDDPPAALAPPPQLAGPVFLPPGTSFFSLW